MIAGAVRTDLILSAEIMVIALDEVVDESFWARLAILVVVAFVITIAVYGVVALIVKMDDVGLLLTQRSSAFAQRLGHGLVVRDAQAARGDLPGRHRRDAVGGRPHPAGQRARGRPGGTRRTTSSTTSSTRSPHAVGALGGVLGWCVNTAISAVIGLVVGAVVVVIVHLLPIGDVTRRAGGTDRP